MDTLFFQQYWWFLISLLGAFLVFLLFVQGGQSLLFQIGKTEMERTMLVNALGRKWEFTFTTLVTFGGGFFASFPLFYSTSFGGAYWLWMSILACFIIQAVSYEFRSKANNVLGKRTFEVFLFINGIGIVLLGVVVATLFNGGAFLVEKSNLTNPNTPIISSWGNAWHGIDALFNYKNLLLGFGVLFLARSLAELYFIQTINDANIQMRSRKFLVFDAALFLLFFLPFLFLLLIGEGYAVNPENGSVSLVAGKYFTNFIEMPIVLMVFLLGVISLLFGIVKTLLKKTFTHGIWFAGVGTIAAVLGLFLIAGWNNTAFYPSTLNIQNSLTIQNSSSSLFTLKVMSVVSLIIPFVLWYIILTWKAINNKTIDAEEMSEKGHKY